MAEEVTRLKFGLETCHAGCHAGCHAQKKSLGKASETLTQKIFAHKNHTKKVFVHKTHTPKSVRKQNSDAKVFVHKTPQKKHLRRNPSGLVRRREEEEELLGTNTFGCVRFVYEY